MYETLMHPQRPFRKKNLNLSERELRELLENLRADRDESLRRSKQLLTSTTDCAPSPISSSSDSAAALSFIDRLIRAVTLVFTFRRNRP